MGREVDGARVRVVIVGRRPDVRRALEIRLALERDVVVVGSSPSVEATLPVLKGLRAQVLLIDLDAGPDLREGAVVRARAAASDLRVVLLTHHPAAWSDGRLVGIGADQVVHKGADAGPLLDSIRNRRQQKGFV